MGEAFVNRIEKIRQENGLSLADIADELSMTRQNFSRMLRNPHRITLSQAQDIANVLKKDIAELLLGTESFKEKLEGLESKNETLSLKLENTELHYQKARATFAYYWYGIIDNIAIFEINASIMKYKEDDVQYGDILKAQISPEERLVELIERYIMEVLGLPDFFSEKDLKEMIKAVVEKAGHILDIDVPQITKITTKRR